MSIKSYEENQLLCNVSVNGTDSNGLTAYRGDLVIIDGEIADAQGRRLPPKAVIKQAVVLADGDQLKMVAGAISNLNLLTQFDEKYQGDLQADTPLLFYVQDLSKPITTEIEGKLYICIPYEDGAVWSMLMDDLRLEKSDFKGQSAEDKVTTIYDNIQDFKPKYPNVALQDAIADLTREVVGEARGPV